MESKGRCGTRVDAGLTEEMEIAFPGRVGDSMNLSAAFPVCENLNGSMCKVKGEVCHVLEVFRQSPSF